jgi:hypothetical protein
MGRPVVPAKVWKDANACHFSALLHVQEKQKVAIIVHHDEQK